MIEIEETFYTEFYENAFNLQQIYWKHESWIHRY